MVGEPPLGVQIELDRYGRTTPQRSERRHEAPFRQDRGVYAVRDFPQLFEHVRKPIGYARQLTLERAELWGHGLLGRAQLQPERAQPLLGAVMEITFDPSPRLVGGR